MNCKDCGKGATMLHGDRCTDCECKSLRCDTADAMAYAMRWDSNVSATPFQVDYAKLEVEILKASAKIVNSAPIPARYVGAYGESDVTPEWQTKRFWPPAEPEKPKLSHYADAKIDDTREVDGVTWRVVKVEDDTTVWWGKGAYAKMEVCCPPLPPRDESYGKPKVPASWQTPIGKANDILRKFAKDAEWLKRVMEYQGNLKPYSNPLRVPLDDVKNYAPPPMSYYISPPPLSFTRPARGKL